MQMTEYEKQTLMKQFFNCAIYLNEEDAKEIKDILLNAMIRELEKSADDCK